MATEVVDQLFRSKVYEITEIKNIALYLSMTLT